ncbi:MAG: hypothetical protein ABIL06_21690 [Pseudomonadota bacterium]
MKLTADDIRKNYEFDAVGITRHEEKTIIVLGIETEPDKNLDEFIGGDKEYETWCFSGFNKYFSPVVDKFLFHFERDDKKARPLEGYDKSINMKELAVKAGIGIQGRNTLIISERFQSRLRFRAVQTTLKIEPTGNGYYSKEKNVRCDDCRLCELVCPVEALKDYKLPVPALCLAHRQLTNRKPNLVRCNLCWRTCTKDLYWAKQKRLARDTIIKMMRPEYENMYDQ